MPSISWPRKLRKQKPYSAEELTRGNCLAAAQAIIRSNRGQGDLIEIVPSPNERRLGPVYPPSGGEVTEWFDHRAVLIGGRYYDCMTGPEGMTESEYRALFLHGDELVFRKVSEL